MCRGGGVRGLGADFGLGVWVCSGGYRLGSGAFAEVKKAREIATGRHVAIKVSPLEGFVSSTWQRRSSFLILLVTHCSSSQVITKHRFAQNPKTLQLFEREVSILQQLQHVSEGVALWFAIRRALLLILRCGWMV